MENQEPRIESMQQWIERRDKWYVETLSYYGIPAEDIVNSNWSAHGISAKVDMGNKWEILCIKGEQVGEPCPMHEEHVAKILAMQSMIIPGK